MKPLSVIVTDDRFGHYEIEKRVLDEIGASLTLLEDYPERERKRQLARADALLVNQLKLTAEVIASLSNCRVISRYGTGYDNVDVEVATQRGIWVARVPDYCREEVAEHALALLLSCVRRVVRTDAGVREGKWDIHPQLRTRRVSGKVIGIVGFGFTGRSFRRKISGLGLSKILICDHRVRSDELDENEEVVSLERLLSEADFISLHIPMRPANFHLIDSAAFESMKPGAILINTSRGPIVEQEALVGALRTGRIDSAGIDVFEAEPPTLDLSGLENVVVSDHCAYYSEESFVELKEKAARNVLEVLRGRAPLYPVNHIGPIGVLRGEVAALHARSQSETRVAG